MQVICGFLFSELQEELNWVVEFQLQILLLGLVLKMIPMWHHQDQHIIDLRYTEMAVKNLMTMKIPMLLNNTDFCKEIVHCVIVWCATIEGSAMEDSAVDTSVMDNSVMYNCNGSLCDRCVWMDNSSMDESTTSVSSEVLRWTMTSMLHSAEGPLDRQSINEVQGWNLQSLYFPWFIDLW